MEEDGHFFRVYYIHTSRTQVSPFATSQHFRVEENVNKSLLGHF